MDNELEKKTDTKLKKIHPLEKWQTKFFKLFYEKAEPIETDLNMEIMIEDNKISVYGSSENIEKVYDEVKKICSLD